MDYRHVIRRQWSNLVREMPEARDFLSDPVLTHLFTEYEHSEISSAPSAKDRSEKLVRAVERKGEDVYRAFLSVLKRYRPSLANKLTQTAELDSVPAPRQHIANGHYNRPNADIDMDCEDAGVMDFNACGPGSPHHLQHMSITCRHTLASQINQLAIFDQFCQALGVDEELRRKASRSGNPTAYMLQEFQEKPEATFDRLEQALSHMGRRDLFDQVWQLMQNGVH